eukprot:CAMPEP_0195538378 /NCGR_PEP_ID=MMETSP0794_2-20130614/49493_1 /TAXON_ID=515487 /ORGANISM="Stephanopyxis turris, Strain CCMP 815" /LENGTH=785 /DNA_ID=CAMNT_0040672351 /DNA_START=230 /DNA_END=2587 /DNA_ORIENTATION=-
MEGTEQTEPESSVPVEPDAFVVAEAQIRTARRDVEVAEGKVKDAKSEVVAAEDKVAAAEDKVAAAKGEVAAAEDKVAAAKVEVAAAEGKVAAAEGKVAAAEGKIDDAEAAQDAAQVQLTAAMHAFQTCSTQEKSECEARLQAANTIFQRAQNRSTRALNAYNTANEGLQAAQQGLQAAQKYHDGLVDLINSLRAELATIRGRGGGGSEADKYAVSGDQNFPKRENFQAGVEFNLQLATERTKRDNKYGVKDTSALIVTQGAQSLVEAVWGRYNDDKSPICISGAPGTGKSCAATILAVAIASWQPAVKVFHLREYFAEGWGHIRAALSERSRARQKSFVIVDQLKHDAEAYTVATALAHVCLVLIASANLPYFYTKRLGNNDDPTRYYYPFSGSVEDCAALARVSPSDVLVAPVVPNTFKQMLLVPVPPTDTPLAACMKWSNFHLLTVKRLTNPARPETGYDIQRDYVKTIVESFSQSNTFYLLVYDMFMQSKVVIDGFEGESSDSSYFPRMKKMKTAKIPVNSSVRKHLDYRFVDESGLVLSPAILQALERALLDSPPPNGILSHADLNRANASARGFIIERQCLTQANLDRVAHSCMQHLNLNLLAVRQMEPIRFMFREIREVVAKVEAMRDKKDPVCLHCIPLKWNFRHIDALQIYTDFQEQSLIIGTQVTIQTAGDHGKSLDWNAEAETIAQLLQQPTVVLAFVAKRKESARVLRTNQQTASSWKEAKWHVVDIPVEYMVDTTTASTMGWVDPNNGIDGPDEKTRSLMVKVARAKKTKQAR